VTDPVLQSPAAILELPVRQRAFLLDQIAGAPCESLGKGAANRAIPAAAKRELELDTSNLNRLRSDMTAEGLLKTERANRIESYQLTDKGRAYLEQHRSSVPTLPTGRVGVVTPPSNDLVRKFRISYLLLQLLKAERHTLSQGEANRFDALGRRLELNAATARAIRHELAEQGLLAISKQNRFEAYTLTPEGRLQLGTLAFDDDFEFKIRGRVLNDLLEAAREAAKQFAGAPADTVKRDTGMPAEAVIPETSRLDEAILRAFEELLRERHTVTGMVPIHEVRAEVRKHLGETAARHDAFDPVILSLRQAGRLRLVPITDGTKASLEQLQASVPGIGETLFFLEAAYEPVAR
jgi:predicted transcriptional regulator